MFHQHLIILSGLFLLVCAQEASNSTKSDELLDPRRIHGNRVLRHNLHLRGRHHGPDIFQRMRPVEHEGKPELDLHHRQPLVATEAPAPVEKVEKSAVAVEENSIEVPTKLKGSSEGNGLRPRARMHSEPHFMRHSELFRGRANLNEAQPGLAHFHSGISSSLTNENTAEENQPEHTAETQKVEVQGFPHFRNHRQGLETKSNVEILSGADFENSRAAESDKVEDFNNGPAPFFRGNFFDRFARQQQQARGLDDARDGSVIRMVNRPPDIIIRNTFQDRPKSFIDLRIMIDDNGVLNVEAGPQGIVRNNRTSTSSVNQMASNVDDEDHEDLEEHWMRNRPSKNIHHVSGHWEQQEFDRSQRGPVRDKRIPFWLLRGGNNHARFGHGPFPMFEDWVSRASLNSGEKMEESPKSQIQISGASMPPHIPSDEMKSGIQSASKLGAKFPMQESIVDEIMQESKRDEDDTTQAESATPEPETNMNIDDFSSSGCDALHCQRGCPGGLTKLDLSTGCPSCDCCPEITCRLTCPSGYKSDESGCPVCRCVQ